MSRSYMCSGSVSPSRFVKADTTKTGGYVLQATDGAGSAGDLVVGISQSGTRSAPIPGLNDGFAGIADVNTIEVLTETDEGWVQSGAAFAFGARLKSNADGKAIAVSADGDNYGAVAMQSADAADKLVKVRVMIGQRAS